jgi:hypothetical protein
VSFSLGVTGMQDQLILKAINHAPRKKKKFKIENFDFGTQTPLG